MPSLEEILHKVVLADSELINQGTEELREAFRKPDIIPSLCQVMGTAKELQIRQYSAVLLRRRLSRKRNWNQLSTDIKKGIQDGIIQALIIEPERLVKNSMAQLIGVIVKHMKRVDQQWPNLMNFLQQSIQSNNLEEQELGTLTLAGIAEMNIDAMAHHMPFLCQLFKHVLETNSSSFSSVSVYNTVTCMKLFVPALKQHKNCVNMYASLVPLVVNAANAMAVVDADRACSELELIEDLLEDADSAIQPHIGLIISNCLQLAANPALGHAVRNKAILLTGWIARKKKKSFLKLNLLQPTVDVMFQIMSTPTDEDEKEEQEDFGLIEEAGSPNKVAVQTIDALGFCLPPDKFMPLLAQYVEPAVQGDDIYKKKAAYLVLAVIVDGCNLYVREKCLEPFVVCIAKGIADPSPVVRNSALYALGQFSEHLQPDINKFAPQLLPVLFAYLEQLCASLSTSGKEPPGIDRMFYALENFIENLKDDLYPYLPTLIDRLLLTLDPTRTSCHLRKLALSALGAVATPAKDKILPYFPKIIEILQSYLTQLATTKDQVDLQVQALDTLGLYARGLGPEHFMPLAHLSIRLSLDLVKHSGEEADIRKAAYGVFAAVSTVLKDEMTEYLESIVEHMHVSIQSSDFFVPHYKEEADKAFPVFEDVRDLLEEDDIENSDSEESAASELEGVTIKNSFIEEKEEALIALKELAATMEGKFNPYIKKSFDIALQALNYPSEEIKIAALAALVQICINWYKMQTTEAHTELREALLAFIPKISEIIHCDCAHDVVMVSLEAYSTLLKELKGLVLQGPGHKEAIINCVMDVLKCETECQKENETEPQTGKYADDDDDDNDDEAEQDEMLFEYSVDVLAPLGHAMGSEEFAIVFKNLLPIIISRTKPKCSLAQRSFATGMMAECMAPLGPTQLPSLLNLLLPLLLKLSADKDEDVRNNAVFALGELARHGKEAVYPHYSQILQALSVTLSKPDNGPYVLDNVCGAIARLILSNVEGVPLNQVLPVFLKQIPLRADFDELKTVFECIAYLYQLGCPQLVQHLDRVILAAADVLGTEKAPKETHDAIFELLRMIQRDFPDQFNKSICQLSESDAKRLDSSFIKKLQP